MQHAILLAACLAITASRIISPLEKLALLATLVVAGIEETSLYRIQNKYYHF